MGPIELFGAAFILNVVGVLFCLFFTGTNSALCNLFIAFEGFVLIVCQIYCAYMFLTFLF
jgi:hypothetical protein